jgi:hypothetical protein
MPPTLIIPGFQSVVRSAGSKLLGSMLLRGDVAASASPDLSGAVSLAGLPTIFGLLLAVKVRPTPAIIPMARMDTRGVRGFMLRTPIKSPY